MCFTDFLGGANDEIAVALLLEHGAFLKFQYDDSTGRLIANTDYRAARELSGDELEVLVNCTAGQWSDGIGETFACESFDRFGYSIQADGEDLKAELIDDGIASSGNTGAPLFAAIDAGDMDALQAGQAAGADVHARLVGCTPLHWAIFRDDAEFAIELSKWCDPNALDALPSTPLTSLACSQISDLDAVRVAKALIEAGAEVKGTEMMPPPAELAKDRDKPQLHEYLAGQ